MIWICRVFLEEFGGGDGEKFAKVQRFAGLKLVCSVWEVPISEGLVEMGARDATLGRNNL